jgi:hypothetical protein
MFKYKMFVLWPKDFMFYVYMLASSHSGTLPLGLSIIHKNADNFKVGSWYN